MNKYSLIRKIASLLLLLCFVLPLSKCTHTTQEGVEEITYNYGYEYLSESIDRAIQGKALEESVISLMLLITFFLPALCLFLKPLPQSIATILGSIPSGYFIYWQLTLYTPQIGGWLALLSWAVLLILSVQTIWQYLLNKRRAKSPP